MTNPAASGPTLEQVCAEAVRLPCAPALLPRLIAVLQDANSDAAQIGELIQLDQALAAASLRTANSVALGGAEPVATLAEAVLRLGQREVFRIAALALVHRWEEGVGLSGYGAGPGDFCRHALCTALAASALAERTNSIEPQLAYTSGLVCDLGKLAIAHTCPAQCAAVGDAWRRQSGTWSEAERTVLGFDAGQVSGELLRRWKFPSLLVAAAEFWQHPHDAPVETHELLAALHAGKYLATSLGPGLGDDGFLFELQSNFLLEHGYTPELLDSVLPVVCERASELLREKLTCGSLAF